MVGNNIVQNNAGTGVFVRAGTAYVGDTGFGLPIDNTISGNGFSDPTNGGLFAFEGGSILVRDATISGNNGAEVQLYETGTVEIRGGSVSATSNPAITAHFGSRVRLRDGASVVSSGNDGAQLSDLSSLTIRTGDTTPATLQGNGTGKFAVRCYSTSTFTGDLTNVSGTDGQSTGCNVFP
jgi:hypothetical protein